ncbi:MAG: TetR/AcrR family transcriptional regulator [Acidobacteria bacterium]|nr:TetR/AcrR family transcriptional regulator [Acidobacteriota bacterium]
MSFRQGLERLSAQGELKASLLLVALTHFAARGYEGVQVKEVAEEAGVSKPTLYYHFGSKEGLFRQLCLVTLSVTERRVQAMVAPLLDHPADSPETVRAACERLASEYMELLLEVPEFTGFILRSIAVPAPDSGFRDLMPLAERALSPIGLFLHRMFGFPLDAARREVMLFTGIMAQLLEEKLRRPDFVVGEAELHWAVGRWLRGLQG